MIVKSFLNADTTLVPDLTGDGEAFPV